MTKRDLLLEIGLEELPARFVTNSMNQLSEKIQQWFQEKKVDHGEVVTYSTPRRLAVYVKDVNEAQADIHEEARGPAKKIALDENGAWTKAAEGFCRGQGVTVDDIFFKELKGVEYVYVKKFIPGRKTAEILPELKKLVSGITFPKTMRWANNDMRYIRPIKWIVALYGTEVIPFSITNVTTDRMTTGHRFLGKKVKLNEPAEYEEKLEKEYVIVDPKKRKTMIVEQIGKLAKENIWNVVVEEDLLEEVNNLVEYPTALYGQFEEHFLSLPEEVLVTSMKEHQRYFSVRAENGALLPYFVTVRNGNDAHLDVVAHGNEKVIKARLADSEFFYEEDQRMSITEALKKLNSVVYHEDIGTVTEKMARVRQLTNQLATLFNFSEKETSDADRAAEICKFDLVTQMVDEFPELQGFMGEKYALIHGENEQVARAIDEHYQPRHAGDNPPASNVSAVLSLADKLDTIVSFFAIDVIPTGSQDPYALRRQAAGVIEILIHKNWEIPLEELLGKSLVLIEKSDILKKDKQEVIDQLQHFFKLRVKHELQEQTIRYDLVDALLAGQVGNVPALIKRANILNEQKETPMFKEQVEALSRVLNIAKNREVSGEITRELFENDFEQELFMKYEQLITQLEMEHSEAEFYDWLMALKEPINQYFDHTMVMAENEAVRQNRINQMVRLSEVISSFATFNKIIVK